MPRWAAHGQGETRVASEGDARFNGLDTTRDRPLLQPGTLAWSQNKRLKNGIAATRPGIVWQRDFNPSYTNTNPLVGSGVFSNPNGGEMLLVGEQNATFVWALQFGRDPVQIPIVAGTLNPANETGKLDCTQVKFVQAFDHVYLLRRPSTSHSTLIWDGTLPPSGTAVFTPVTIQPGPPSGSVMIPGGVDPATPTQVLNNTFCPWNGEPFAERIIFFNDQYSFRDPSGIVPDRDTIVMTDPDRWDSYNPATNSFRINSGEANMIMRVLGYYRGSVLVFFRRGVHILENFTNPASGTIGDQRQINNFLGLAACEALCQVGVDVYFLSESGRGVYRISEAVQDQIAVNPLAVSDPIQSLIDTLNLGQAKYATMKTLGLYVYLGLPQYTNIGNNAMPVFNQYSREWESVDYFNDPAFFFQEMHVILCGDQRQLITVDWPRKQVYGMYYDGTITDQIGLQGTDFTISDIMETRGYTLRDPTSFKRFERVNIGLQTFDPYISVESISDGYNEVKLLTSQTITKNRLRFYVHGHKFFNASVDDPDAPKREDYGDNPPSTSSAVEDFASLPVGVISTWPGQNFSVYNGDKQQTLERFQIRQNGRWASIRITNDEGNCDVMAVSVDGLPVQEGIHSLA
jgi:hypothetical protein